MRRVLHGITGNLSNTSEYHMVIFTDLFSVRTTKDYSLDAGTDRVSSGVRCLRHHCFGACSVGGSRTSGRAWQTTCSGRTVPLPGPQDSKSSAEEAEINSGQNQEGLLHKSKNNGARIIFFSI